MKRMTTLVALIFAVSIAMECQAQKPQRGQGQRGQAQRGQGQRGQGQRGQGQRGQGAPAEMAAQMMKQFDKDGDQKLDSSELTAMLTAMRERRARGQQGDAQGPPGQGRRGAGQGRPQNGAAGRGGQQGKGPGRADRNRGRKEDAPSGGVKPERPAAE